MAPTYLIIGHVSHDITPDGPRLGGTVAYSSLMADALGYQVRILTSSPPSPLITPLEGFDLTLIPSPEPTSFENVYTKQGRQQWLHSRATPLTVNHLPTEWVHSDVVHIAPIAQEVTLDLVLRVSARATRIITPQGFMRGWSDDGSIHYKQWAGANTILPHMDAVIFSIEDVQSNEADAQALVSQAPIGIITRSDYGAELYAVGKKELIPAPDVAEVNATGAGDVFAASFAVRYHQTGDPLTAARFANIIAADSVTRTGWNSIPSKAFIQQTLRSTHE